MIQDIGFWLLIIGLIFMLYFNKGKKPKTYFKDSSFVRNIKNAKEKNKLYQEANYVYKVLSSDDNGVNLISYHCYKNPEYEDEQMRRDIVATIQENNRRALSISLERIGSIKDEN